MASVMPEITKYAPNACYIIVSNPVDVLTYEAIQVSGLNPKHVFGSGTVLDSSRLRTCLADHANLNIKNIHAYVFGEHGDSSMIPWSLSSIDGMKFVITVHTLTIWAIRMQSNRKFVLVVQKLSSARVQPIMPSHCLSARLQKQSCGIPR